MNLHERFICKKNDPCGYDGLYFGENHLIATMRYEACKSICVLTWHEGSDPITMCFKSHDCQGARKRRDDVVKAACCKYETGKLPSWFVSDQKENEVVNRIIFMLRSSLERGEPRRA